MKHKLTNFKPKSPLSYTEDFTSFSPAKREASFWWSATLIIALGYLIGRPIIGFLFNV
jgi:hypothetical protein